MLIIKMMVTKTTAEAYALFCTSTMGELNWKNMARGKVAVGWFSAVGI